MGRRRLPAMRRATVYFRSDMYAQIQALAARDGTSVTRVVEELTARGLELAAGTQLERAALPAIRSVVEEVIREELLGFRQSLAPLLDGTTLRLRASGR